VPKVSIDYNRSDGIILLSGDIASLVNNRYAKRYILDYLTKDISIPLIVKVEGDEVQFKISMIVDMLTKYGYESNLTQTSEKIVTDFFEEEKQFKSFSDKAKRIRNDDCDPTEFSIFADSIAKNMPQRRLYDLQLLSAFHLAFAQNACNFSVPGAGKTSVVYGAYSYLSNLDENDIKKVDKLMVVGPLSSFLAWESEYEECFGKFPNSRRLVGNDRQWKTDYLYSSKTADLTLISYESLIRLVDEIQFFLKNNKVMVVLDEAHKIKNTSGGEKAQSVLNIAPLCSSRVVLTGTPAPNGYEDLFNLFKFIWPTKNIIGYRVNQLADMSSRIGDPRVDGLVQSLLPFFVRIKKSDLHIPDPIYNPPIVVPMGEKQRKIYDFIERRYVDSMSGKNIVPESNKFRDYLVKAKTIRLMQAASNPSLLNKPLEDYYEVENEVFDGKLAIDDTEILEEIRQYCVNETPSKFIVAGDLIEKIISNGGKVVVWACFVQTINNFSNYLNQRDIISESLYGAVPVEYSNEYPDNESDEKTREKIIRAFHEKDSKFKVLIANPFAVAESISLHKVCHNAIYLERTFNAAHYMQSKDRIHRFGLKPDDIINYYYILSQDSVDEIIDERLNIKERRMMEIIESDPIPLFRNAYEELGNEDIRAIINGYIGRCKKI